MAAHVLASFSKSMSTYGGWQLVLKTTFTLLILLFAEVARAERLVTTVVSVLAPSEAGDPDFERAANEPWIVLLSVGGRALRIESSDEQSLAVIGAVAGKPRFIEIEYEDIGTVDRIKSVQERPDMRPHASDGALPIEPQSQLEDPSVGRIDFPFGDRELSVQGLFEYFSSFGLRRNSQCFHRAYYWSHQLWRQTGAMTHKVFMFFTGKYIRRFNYHWWFHVAPYVHDESGQEIVLDPTYLKKPVTMRQWTNNFLRNDPECPIVTDYKGHHAQEREAWCYLVKVPMYYYHPNTVENARRNGLRIDQWDKGWLTRSRTAR